MPTLWAALSRATVLRRRERPSAPMRRCGLCRHFRNDARYLETAIPGLSSLSSASASVRADDGICTLRERYLSAHGACTDFAPAGESAQ